MIDTCKIHDHTAGGLNLYIPKDIARVVKLPKKENLRIEYNEETNELIIGEMR